VTEADGFPAAVLIRALEPVEGLTAMRRRRNAAPWRKGKGPVPDHELCRGPGNLSRALGISLDDNLCHLSRGPITIQDRGVKVGKLVWDGRIGLRVGADKLWRVSIAGHRSVSGN
jgi:DNA-3-methyladenine glycosylase